MNKGIKVDESTKKELFELMLPHETYDGVVRRLLLMGMILAKLNDKIPRWTKEELDKLQLKIG